MRGVKAIGYGASRWLIGKIIRPKVVGNDPAALCADPADLIYALEYRSLSDLIVLDLVSQAQGLPSPLTAATVGDITEARRVFFLQRASHGWFQRPTMTTLSARMVRILQEARADSTAVIVPVGIFWSRAPQRNRSLVKGLISENWAVASRLRRVLNLLISRKDIVVHVGNPIPLTELSRADPDRLARRAARLLRVQFRNQRVATIGPDFSHRRTLVDQILKSRAVRDVIEQLGQTEDAAKLEKRARKAAISIASNMSHPTIRVLARLLSWFWNRIYNGIDVNNLAQIAQIGETHTLIYVPSHRSHLDYLLLSHLLYRNGLMIPHIAAGENLNLPAIGAILRRGGAFFMRRSFRGDSLYSAVFSEYLYQVYRRGHCVEFFPEGGRTRTGRLLPARLGLLKMTLESHNRGLPRPIALIPVYFGYEKLVEGGSYLDELRGSAKKRETVGDVLSSLRLIRQNFGKVAVNFGEAIVLDDWLRDNVADDSSATTAALGREILHRINDVAAINPINLTALVTLTTPRLALDEKLLAQQLDSYVRLLSADAEHHRYTITDLPGREIIRYVEGLGMLTREHQEFGDVMTLDPFTAVLMTWYRNNVAHTLALPSLLACLISNRRRPLSTTALHRMVNTVFPYIATELNFSESEDAVERWLGHLMSDGLLEASGNDYCAPRANSAAHYQLHLLARVVSPTLERMYIVIRLLHEHQAAGITREELQRKSHQVARKMSRLYGIDAPEFFDTRLFNLFIDQLIANAAVTAREGGALERSSLISDVLKAAESVIDAEFRYAIMQET